MAELAEAGLSQREIADVVGVDAATVNRDLRVAHATDEEETPRNDEDARRCGVAFATDELAPDAATVSYAMLVPYG